MKFLTLNLDHTVYASRQQRLIVRSYSDLPTSMKFRNSLRIFLPITEKARNYGKFLQITDFFKL